MSEASELVTQPNDRARNREKIIQFESMLRNFAPADMPVTHRFARGPEGILVYTREMFAKAGIVAVGKIHKYENVSIISKGSFSVYTEEGRVLYIKAPYSWVAPPGTKRAAYFHEDTIWTTVHACHSTDLVEVEKELIADSFDDPELISKAFGAFKLEDK